MSFDGVVAELVGLAVRDAAFDAAAGHPHREAADVVVAPAFGLIDVALGHRRAAEFAAPDDERVVEHAALLEVGDQRGARLDRPTRTAAGCTSGCCRGSPNRGDRR